jgi:hypothetical protein
VNAAARLRRRAVQRTTPGAIPDAVNPHLYEGSGAGRPARRIQKP